MEELGVVNKGVPENDLKSAFSERWFVIKFIPVGG